MIDHITLAILTGIVLFYLNKIFTFGRILTTNLQTQQDERIQTALNDISHVINTTTKRAYHTLYRATCTILIGIFSLLNLLTIWVFVYLQKDLFPVHIWVTTITMATFITVAHTMNTYPKWLIDWTQLLINKQDEISLALIQEQLADVRMKLEEVKQGKIIPEQELTELKNSAFFLSNLAIEISAEMEEDY